MVQIASKLKKIKNYEKNRKIKTLELLEWSFKKSFQKMFLDCLSTFLFLKAIGTFVDQKMGIIFKTLNKTSGIFMVQKWFKKWTKKVPIAFKDGKEDKHSKKNFVETSRPS